jgi:HKD family nuclease
MSVSSTVLFGQPQHELASLLRNHLDRCTKAEIVAGFLTVEGAGLIQPPFAADPTKLATLIVGAGTYRAFDALDQLIGQGVDPDSLFVHLGHTRLTGNRAKHRFYRYHPMLHSKIYCMEHADGTASAFIGSHNITGYALKGLNGEASVLLEGPIDAQQFADIRSHIAEARQQSQRYSPNDKEALAWWTRQSFEGIRDKANDAPRDSENKRTLVILAESTSSKIPARGEIVYFELPLALGRISSLESEVHLYIFDSLPSSPWTGLQNLRQAKGTVWCKTQGLEMAKGGVELKADWFVDSNTSARLVETQNVRPTPADEMQQVRVQAYNQVRGNFEYLFDSGHKKWLPVLTPSDAQSVEASPSSLAPLQVDDQFQSTLESLKLSPNAEHLPWELVYGLTPAEEQEGTSNYKQALVEYSPEGGSYIMLSLRRRQKG